MKLHKWEQAFWDAWLEHGIEGNDLKPRLSVRVDFGGVDKVYEFDFGSESQRLLIECDGLGGFDPVAKRERCGSHQTPRGMADDSIKRNAALIAGWRVMVFPSSRLNSNPRMMQAIEEVNRALCARA